MKVSHEDQNGGRGRGFGWGRDKGRGRGRQFANKAIVECFKCHKLGHFQYECPRWKESANYTEIDEEEEMLLMSFVEVSNSKQEDTVYGFSTPVVAITCAETSSGFLPLMKISNTR